MVAFIDQYRDQYGVEPICKELLIAPSTYHRHKILEQHPERRSTRTKRDEQLALEVQRVWEENHRNYGARKVWKQLNRESLPAARCTVERLMKQLGIEGAVSQRYRLRPLTNRSIWLIASSQPTTLTNFGLPILLMWRLGRGLCMSPL